MSIKYVWKKRSISYFRMCVFQTIHTIFLMFIGMQQCISANLQKDLAMESLTPIVGLSAFKQCVTMMPYCDNSFHGKNIFIITYGDGDNIKKMLQSSSCCVLSQKQSESDIKQSESDIEQKLLGVIVLDSAMIDSRREGEEMKFFLDPFLYVKPYFSKFYVFFTRKFVNDLKRNHGPLRTITRIIYDQVKKQKERNGLALSFNFYMWISINDEEAVAPSLYVHYLMGILLFFVKNIEEEDEKKILQVQKKQGRPLQRTLSLTAYGHRQQSRSVCARSVPHEENSQYSIPEQRATVQPIEIKRYEISGETTYKVNKKNIPIEDKEQIWKMEELRDNVRYFGNQYDYDSLYLNNDYECLPKILIDSMHWISVDAYVQSKKLSYLKPQMPYYLLRRYTYSLNQQYEALGKKKGIIHEAERMHREYIKTHNGSFDQQKWAQVKVRIMYKAIFEKFLQNVSFKQMLMATENYVLVGNFPLNTEGDAENIFWNSAGCNATGNILGVVREHLRFVQ